MNAPHILVIEDEKNLARTLAVALRQAFPGAEVALSHDGNDAASTILAQRFDLVISDLRLPDVSGLTLLVRLKQLYPETRCIVMTAYGSDDVEERARYYADAFLDKPFDLPQMIAAARQVLESPESTATPPEAHLPEADGAIVRPPQTQRAGESSRNGPAADAEAKDSKAQVSLPDLSRAGDAGRAAPEMEAMIIDRNGNLLVDTGDPAPSDRSLLGTLLLSSIAAADGVALALKQPAASETESLSQRENLSLLHYYRTGEREIFCRPLDEQLVLALIVDAPTSTAPMDSIWRYLERTLARLREQKEELALLDFSALQDDAGEVTVTTFAAPASERSAALFDDDDFSWEEIEGDETQLFLGL